VLIPVNSDVNPLARRCVVAVGGHGAHASGDVGLKRSESGGGTVGRPGGGELCDRAGWSA
jgi:hypothetical protein